MDIIRVAMDRLHSSRHGVISRAHGISLLGEHVCF